jgi:hypothetical protein
VGLLFSVLAVSARGGDGGVSAAGGVSPAETEAAGVSASSGHLYPNLYFVGHAFFEKYTPRTTETTTITIMIAAADIYNISVFYSDTGLVFDLQAEHGNAERKQEGVQQGVHLAQDANVIDEHTVPQEPKHKRQNHNVQKEDGELSEQFTGVTG